MIQTSEIQKLLREAITERDARIRRRRRRRVTIIMAAGAMIAVAVVGALGLWIDRAVVVQREFLVDGVHTTTFRPGDTVTVNMLLERRTICSIEVERHIVAPDGWRLVSPRFVSDLDRGVPHTRVGRFRIPMTGGSGTWFYEVSRDIYCGPLLVKTETDRIPFKVAPTHHIGAL